MIGDANLSHIASFVYDFNQSMWILFANESIKIDLFIDLKYLFHDKLLICRIHMDSHNPSKIWDSHKTCLDYHIAVCTDSNRSIKT